MSQPTSTIRIEILTTTIRLPDGNPEARPLTIEVEAFTEQDARDRVAAAIAVLATRGAK
jgi:hypothetical protein